MKISSNLIFLLLTLLISKTSFADSQLIDKIYHPYVLDNEREIEWRFYERRSDDGTELAQRLGYGFSIGENVTFEAYVIGDKQPSGDFTVHSYEGEIRWMLADQGKYFIDTGLLFEVERDNTKNTWEITTGFLAEKEFGRTSLTGNFFLLYNYGDQTEQELTTQIRIQYRYRLMLELQPAIELYTDDEYIGVGPAFMGVKKFSPSKRLKWEAAYIVGFNGDDQDKTFRFSIEYEF